MDEKLIVDTIMKNNDYNDYSLEQKSNKDKCCYKKNGTIIHLSSKNNEIYKIIIAAHESSHTLNFYEGRSNYSLLITLEKLWWIMFFVSPVYISFSFIVKIFFDWNIKSISILNTLLIISSMISICYLVYYLRDESLAEKRALKELEKIPLISNELKVSIKKESKKRLNNSIYKKVLIMIPVNVSLLILFTFIGIFIFRNI